MFYSRMNKGSKYIARIKNLLIPPNIKKRHYLYMTFCARSSLLERMNYANNFLAYSVILHQNKYIIWIVSFDEFIPSLYDKWRNYVKHVCRLFLWNLNLLIRFCKFSITNQIKKYFKAQKNKFILNKESFCIGLEFCAVSKRREDILM